MGFRSVYSDGGASADYTMDLGGGGGLQGQLSAMANFDPSLMLDYMAARQDYLDNLRYTRGKREYDTFSNRESVSRARENQRARNDQGRARSSAAAQARGLGGDPQARALQERMDYLNQLHGPSDFRPLQYAAHPMRNLIAAGTSLGMNFAAPSDPWLAMYQAAADRPSAQAISEAGQTRRK